MRTSEKAGQRGHWQGKEGYRAVRQWLVSELCLRLFLLMVWVANQSLRPDLFSLASIVTPPAQTMTVMRGVSESQTQRQTLSAPTCCHTGRISADREAEICL